MVVREVAAADESDLKRMPIRIVRHKIIGLSCN